MDYVKLNVIPGDLAVNRAWRKTPNGVVRSSLYSDTRKIVIHELRDYHRAPTSTAPVKVSIKVVGSDCDIDAPVKGLLDCLQAARVIANDNQVQEIHVFKEDGEPALWISVQLK